MADENFDAASANAFHRTSDTTAAEARCVSSRSDSTSIARPEVADSGDTAIGTGAYEQTTSDNDVRSPLLKLPAELRLIIYELALKEDISENWESKPDNHVDVQRWALEAECYSDDRTKLRVVQPPTARPGLLSVSRQTRDEALPVYYSINTLSAAFFYYAFHADITRFLRMIGKDQAGMIKKLVIRFPVQQIWHIFDHVNEGRYQHGLDCFGRDKDESITKQDVFEAFQLLECGVRHEAIKVEDDMEGVME